MSTINFDDINRFITIFETHTGKKPANIFVSQNNMNMLKLLSVTTLFNAPINNSPHTISFKGIPVEQALNWPDNKIYLTNNGNRPHVLTGNTETEFYALYMGYGVVKINGGSYIEYFLEHTNSRRIQSAAQAAVPNGPHILITDDDIDKLFEDTVKMPNPTDPFQGIMIKDKDYWWNQKGVCPICKDNTRPEVQPGGYFKCPKCGWCNT